MARLQPKHEKPNPANTEPKYIETDPDILAVQESWAKAKNFYTPRFKEKW